MTMDCSEVFFSDLCVPITVIHLTSHRVPNAVYTNSINQNQPGSASDNIGQK